MNLEDRLAAAEALLADALSRHGPRRVWLAWTGGKDSTLALWLWRRVLERAAAGAARCVTIDTGRKFPEVLDFRQRLAAEWGVVVEEVRPQAEPGYPVAADKLDCCRRLKVEPLKAALARLGVAALITGIRRDEHESRAGRQPLEWRTDPPHQVVNPMLDFTELDVWAAIAGRGIPYCGLYDAGYRSLGCVDCTTLDVSAHADGGERAGRAPDKEKSLGMLTSLGYF